MLSIAFVRRQFLPLFKPKIGLSSCFGTGGNLCLLFSTKGLPVVNFYDFDEGVLKEDIYSTVNGASLQNPSSLNIYGDKMYIVTKNTFHKVDAETFLSEFSIAGFASVL